MGRSPAKLKTAYFGVEFTRLRSNEVKWMPTTTRSTSHPGKDEAPRTITVLGLPVPVPSKGTALYLGGIAALAAAELIDWPVALAVAVGHELLVRSQRSPTSSSAPS